MAIALRLKGGREVPAIPEGSYASQLFGAIEQRGASPSAEQVTALHESKTTFASSALPHQVVDALYIVMGPGDANSPANVNRLPALDPTDRVVGIVWRNPG